jgi:hypothetical protein
MKLPCKIVALQHADGSIGIMQLFADVDVLDEINRSAFHSPVVDHKEVTAEEADILRSNRPKPDIPVPASSMPVSPVNIAEISLVQQENADLKQRVAALEASVSDAIKHQMDQLAAQLAQSLMERKAQEPT